MDATHNRRKPRIRVLVVEDSRSVREFLVHVLERDPEIRVIGTAANGQQALEAVKRLRPDVITMDVHMPGLDGLEATRCIMQTVPTPIVIVSGHVNRGEVSSTFAALEAGALAVLPRLEGLGHSDHLVSARQLLRTVKAMAEVKVVRRWARAERSVAPAPLPRVAARVRLVAIGASTGGPPALQTILSALPADFPVPIAVVQHMTPGFMRGFAEWLGQSCRVAVQLPEHGEALRPGRVYLAPDGHQMALDDRGRIVLSACAPLNGPCPSVSHLFRSIAQAYGRDAVVGLLSGMGRDGAEELRQLKNLNAATFVQDRASSVVFGMPGEAVLLDAAMHVLPPEMLAELLVDLVKGKR